MISPKQPYINLLHNAATAVNCAPLGQMDGEERAVLYVRLRDMAAAGDQVDLGEATKLIVHEVIRAATSIKSLLVGDFTNFIDGQIRGGSMAPGVATLGLLQDLGLDQEWVVFVDKEDGEVLAATAGEYQSILDEVASKSVVAFPELPGLPSFSDLPEVLRLAISSRISGDVEQRLFDVVGRTVPQCNEVPTLEEALDEQAREVEASVDARRHRRAAHHLVETLGEFCRCGECESCRARSAVVTPAELADALEKIAPSCCGKCASCIGAAQELVVQTRAANEAVKEIVEELAAPDPEAATDTPAETEEPADAAAPSEESGG